MNLPASRVNGTCHIDGVGIVLHERAALFEGGDPSGWLSIKSMWGGAASYEVDRRRVDVSDDSYLFLNEGQEYRISIDSTRPVESLCVFFEPRFARDVLRAIALPD